MYAVNSIKEFITYTIFFSFVGFTFVGILIDAIAVAVVVDFFFRSRRSNEPGQVNNGVKMMHSNDNNTYVSMSERAEGRRVVNNLLLSSSSSTSSLLVYLCKFVNFDEEDLRKKNANYRRIDGFVVYFFIVFNID